MASGREARLDAQLAKRTARVLVSYLRENSPRLPVIAEEDAPSEIHAERVALAPDETETADLRIASLSSKCNQAPPPPVLQQEQRVVEKSLKMVLREKDLPFKKRKWAMVVEDDDEIAPLQRVQDDEVQEGGDVCHLKTKADDIISFKTRNRDALVVHDEVVTVLPIQITASPKICDKPGPSSQPGKDPEPVLEEKVKEEDFANRCAISLKRKADAVDDKEVGEDVVAPIKISKGENGEKGEISLPSEARQEEAEQPAHTGIVSPASAPNTVLVQEDEQEIMEENDNDILSETSDRVAVSTRGPGIGRGRGRGGKKRQNKKKDAEKSSRVSGTESKRVASVEEETSEPPVAAAGLEEDGEGERGLPIGSTHEVVEETAHLVQQKEQEIMEEDESRVVLYPGDSFTADTLIDISSSRAAPRLEQTNDRVTVTKRGRGRGRGGKTKKKRTKKKATGESSRGRGRGRGRGRSTASSSGGCRCWLIAPGSFLVAEEDGWLQRLTQDDNSSEGRHDGSTTSSALTVLSSASLMVGKDTAAECLRTTQVGNNSEGVRDVSIEEEENATSALSLLATAALMFTDDSGSTRNDNLIRGEGSTRTNLRIRMDANINGEGTSHDGGDDKTGKCTEE